MKKSILFAICFGFLLVSPIVPVLGEDEVEDDEGVVEGEGDQASQPAKTDKDQDAEEDIKTIEPSPDAETVLVFTHPANNKEFPAGSLVKFLVSFYNKGEKEFIVDNMEASFRYPMDYSFYIQNYTAARYNRPVAPNSEATFDYAFVPSEGFAARPFGLSINMNYHDSDGVYYANAVFNETVNIVEDESGFNPETGFLYVVFAGILILCLLLGRQALSKIQRKHGMKSKPKPVVEMGTGNNKNEVDMEWIPREHINLNNKSPKAGNSPKSGKSPRQRRARRAGDD